MPPGGQLGRDKGEEGDSQHCELHTQKYLQCILITDNRSRDKRRRDNMGRDNNVTIEKETKETDRIKQRQK